MDTIRITGLKVQTIIGVHAWERLLSRTLVLDLTLGTDAATAAASDRIDAALDYSAVARVAADLVSEARVQLIETLAEQLAARLLEHFKLKWLVVTVHKPGAVPGAQDVSVTVERGRRA